MIEDLLKKEERIICELRSVYRKYGYSPYAMSKFEDYEFYIRNKDFLVSDRVIAFNDTNGKMLALKPDVTLSIIKSGKDCPGVKQKVYYNENVYRVSKTTHRYKEIMQAGLECIGDIDFYDLCEVISLAAESLAKISPNYSLVISHLGILSDLLGACSTDPQFREDAIGYIARKNTHDLTKLCETYGIAEDRKQAILSLSGVCGNHRDVIAAIGAFAEGEKAAEMTRLSSFLESTPYSGHIQFDFSVVDDMNYYNGFLFKGYVDGISSEVLSGGQYDNMMKKINRTSSAIGFAIYLDLLDNDAPDGEYDFDVLLLYDGGNDPLEVSRRVRELTGSGLSVSAEKQIPPKTKFRKTVDMRGGGQNA